MFSKKEVVLWLSLIAIILNIAAWIPEPTPLTEAEKAAAEAYVKKNTEYFHYTTKNGSADGARIWLCKFPNNSKESFLGIYKETTRSETNGYVSETTGIYPSFRIDFSNKLRKLDLKNRADKLSNL